MPQTQTTVTLRTKRLLPARQLGLRQLTPSPLSRRSAHPGALPEQHRSGGGEETDGVDVITHRLASRANFLPYG